MKSLRDILHEWLWELAEGGEQAGKDFLDAVTRDAKINWKNIPEGFYPLVARLAEKLPRIRQRLQLPGEFRPDGDFIPFDPRLLPPDLVRDDRPVCPGPTIEIVPTPPEDIAPEETVETLGKYAGKDPWLDDEAFYKFPVFPMRVPQPFPPGRWRKGPQAPQPVTIARDNGLKKTIRLYRDKIHNLGDTLWAYLLHFDRGLQHYAIAGILRPICHLSVFYKVIYHELGHYYVENAVKSLIPALVQGDFHDEVRAWKSFVELRRTQKNLNTTFEEAFVEAFAMSRLSKKEAWREWETMLGFKLKEKPFLEILSIWLSRLAFWAIFMNPRPGPYQGFINFLFAPYRVTLLEDNFLNRSKKTVSKSKLENFELLLDDRALYCLSFNLRCAVRGQHPPFNPAPVNKEMRRKWRQLAALYQKHGISHGGADETFVERLITWANSRPGGRGFPSQLTFGRTTRDSTWQAWVSSATAHWRGYKVQDRSTEVTWNLFPGNPIDATDSDSFPVDVALPFNIKEVFPPFGERAFLPLYTSDDWYAIPKPEFHFR